MGDGRIVGNLPTGGEPVELMGTSDHEHSSLWVQIDRADYVSVDVRHGTDLRGNRRPVEVNWVAFGAQSLEVARVYGELLVFAAAYGARKVGA